MRHYHFASALLPDGWTDNVILSVASDGTISNVATGPAPVGATPFKGAAIPGLANGHSHAFQRAMAGLAEHATSPDDDFWSWRQTMYALANRISPDDLNAIAAQAYVEMLKGGYTAVAEFHYVHDAKRAEGPAEMADAILHAAAETGIGMTLLPVLYQTSGFGAKPPLPEQGRFILETGRYLRLLDDIRPMLGGATLGVSLHSLRAVPPESIAEVLPAIPAGMPVHIHIAEQTGEVEACLAWSGQRPVEWLMANAEVNEHWSLIHATHMTEAETVALARTGAVAGICPTTEANLGDGLFALPTWLDHDGAISIGSDSHICINAAEEIRWLEYGQRLTKRKRNIATFPDNAHVGDHLYKRSVAGGAQSLGIKSGSLEAGLRADIVVLDTDHPALVGRKGATLLDAYVFAAHGNPVSDVIVAGRHVVRSGAHVFETEITERYRKIIRSLSIQP